MTLTAVASGDDQPEVSMAKVVAILVETDDEKRASEVSGVSVHRIKRWKAENRVFQEMYAAAKEHAVNAVIDDALANVRQRVKQLGSKATDVLADALESHDERVKLAAASKVLQLAGVAEKGEPKKKEPGGGIDPGSRD